MSLLEVKNLVVEFPGRRGTLRALDGVSFAIAPGEILGIVGESGAGKSLTGASIIGLLEPPGHIADGEVILNGQRIDNLTSDEMRSIRGRKIGAIFQDPLYFFVLAILDYEMGEFGCLVGLIDCEMRGAFGKYCS